MNYALRQLKDISEWQEKWGEPSSTIGTDAHKVEEVARFAVEWRRSADILVKCSRLMWASVFPNDPFPGDKT